MYSCCLYLVNCTVRLYTAVRFISRFVSRYGSFDATIRPTQQIVFTTNIVVRHGLCTNAFVTYQHQFCSTIMALSVSCCDPFRTTKRNVSLDAYCIWCLKPDVSWLRLNPNLTRNCFSQSLINAIFCYKGSFLGIETPLHHGSMLCLFKVTVLIHRLRNLGTPSVYCTGNQDHEHIQFVIAMVIFSVHPMP